MKARRSILTAMAIAHLSFAFAGLALGQSAPAAGQVRLAPASNIAGPEETVYVLIRSIRQEVAASRANDEKGMKTARGSLRKLVSERTIEERVKRVPAL